MNSQDDQTLVIAPGSGLGQYWRDIWNYRELLFFLVWRDILVRYKQTVLGVAWSVIRPVLTMLVFTVIFGKLAKFPSDGGAPYPVLVFAAMLPWQLFANALGESSASLVSNANLLSKVYFPRMIVPGSAVLVCLVDFLISSLVLLLLMAGYGFWPGWRILTLPFFLGLVLLAAFGAGLFFATMNVRYRDFRYIIPFVVQLGLYVSPVGFSSSIVPSGWRLLYAMNPMVGIIDGFRWAILGSGEALYLPGVTLSLGMAVFFCIVGIRSFRKAERNFADVI